MLAGRTAARWRPDVRIDDDETGLKFLIMPSWRTTAHAPHDQSLDPNIQDQIGRALRAMYDDLVQQPVPDHLLAFLNLLGQPGRRSEH